MLLEAKVSTLSQLYTNTVCSFTLLYLNPFERNGGKKNLMMQNLRGDATVKGEQGPECGGNQLGLTIQLRHLAPSPVQKSRHHFMALSVMP